ncbi:acetylcholinesterase precursor [Periconia macrospinosa]|uniref:Acetylcholinesterase n=1 Tax=Periconia macrospinosa TaxID=97972 RepID=A0A2V1D401_9PLEO|nr:acetylcholinesterase precursor [Periconia macrospinosa]
MARSSYLGSAIAIGLLSAVAQTTPLYTRANVSVSNADTSLTLIYQNNLNASDEANHVGALILDNVSEYSAAAAACASVNERLLPRSTLADYEEDFAPSLAYQSYAGYFDGEDGFYVDGGVFTTQGGGYQTSSSSPQGLPVLCTQSSRNGSSAATPINGSYITVASGDNTFVGYRNKKSFRFLGIPYADTPSRWQYSSLYSGTGQTIQASAYGSQCAQGSSGSEDCFFLNIQTPYIPKAGSRKNLRPVLFWIHGGGFTGGTGSDAVTDGGNLASKEDIVVVSINYRLSTLGFLAIPGTNITGNYGIADQIVALDWVVANIASFGGNPSQITIAGESAGAGSVRALLGSPKAIGKFQGAVALSNLGGGVTLGLNGDYGTTYSSYYTIPQSYTAAGGAQIFSSANCTTNDLACLANVPAPTLVSLPTVARYVVQDGTYVNTPNLILTSSSLPNTTTTANPQTAHVPVIFGVTANDGASFTNFPPGNTTTHAAGLSYALGINATWAAAIIASSLFPFTNSTGNLTLDSFNVSQRIATDKTFRCIDQSTLYSGVASSAFPKAYAYEFSRTIGGYDPNHLGGPKDNDPSNPYFRLHGADLPWVFGNLGSKDVREDEDLWSVQLVSSYFASFVRSADPNPEVGLLEARGYEKVREGVERSGRWGEVGVGGEDEGEVRLLDWPGRRSGWVDVEQCEWLGYGLDYYLKGGV